MLGDRWWVMGAQSRFRFAYPRCDAFSHALLEGQTERAVAAVATFASQLLYRGTDAGWVGFLIALDEIVDAQVVDVGVVVGVLVREILAEIGAVGAKGLNQHGEGEVVL